MTVYLRNTWYVAGFSEELSAAQPLLSRRLLDEPVVFFRDTQGGVRALRDRCPHRFVPLSMGKVKGDSVECGYHGLRFDGSGQCTRNPHAGGVIHDPLSTRAASSTSKRS